MKARTFNSVMPYVNELWAAKVLNMKINPAKGPDLISEDKILEVKFCLRDDNSYKYQCWKALEYQMNYPHEHDLPGFWGLGRYWLVKPVEEIETKNPEKLESLVEKRELFIVEWNWVFQFTAYNQRGKTKISEWNNTIRFLKAKSLPKTIARYEVEKGVVNLTEGVDEKYFKVLSGEIPF